MFFQYELEEFCSYLKNALEDCDVFVAYPYVFKPTKLEKPAVAVSLSSLNVENGALGREYYTGEYKIDADVFVSHSSGSALAEETAAAVLGEGAKLLPLGIALAPITTEAGCFKVKCSFTFASGRSEADE